MVGLEYFLWSELANIPDKPGIYAWYYKPEITSYDLEAAINNINELNEKGETDAGNAFISTFLERHLFRYFIEDPFFARIVGQLKPTYEGELFHQLSPSEGLVHRLREKPERLRLIRDVLELSAPNFASPIYIGMSDRLKGRINGHKGLIERFREKNDSGVGDSKGDAGFARQVVKRKIAPERLFVATCVVDSTDDIHVDLENILNRIFYPILGRN
jgi:hypothetical protein